MDIKRDCENCRFSLTADGIDYVVCGAWRINRTDNSMPKNGLCDLWEAEDGE